MSSEEQSPQQQSSENQSEQSNNEENDENNNENQNQNQPAQAAPPPQAEKKPAKPIIYDGYDNDPGIPIQYLLVILLVTGIVFLVLAFMYPQQRLKFQVAVNLWLFRNEIQDMAFDRTNYSVNVTQIDHGNGDAVNLLNYYYFDETNGSLYLNRYWELAKIPLPYNLGGNVTTVVNLTYSRFNYELVYNVTARQLPGGGYVSNRPFSLIYSAASDPYMRYLSPVDSQAVNNFIGIVDVPLQVFHYKDQRIRTQTSVAGSNVPELGIGIAFLVMFVLLLVIALTFNVLLGAISEQASHVADLFNLPEKVDDEVVQKPRYRRFYEHDGQYAVNVYPPQLPI